MQQTNTLETSGHYLNPSEWLGHVGEFLSGAETDCLPRLRTTLQCKLVGKDPSLLVPPDLAQDQPEILEYLTRFAAVSALTLIEDRRRLALAPIVERRRNNLPDMAMALSMLLQQTGLPGPLPTLSSPHSLHKTSRKIDVGQLLRAARQVTDQSRKVIVIPKSFVRKRLSEHEDSLSVRACQLTLDDNQTKDTQEPNDPIPFVQFHASDFHAIGYKTDAQFILCAYLAGGPIAQPETWSSFKALSQSPFQCQIFNSPYPHQNSALFYRMFYFDLHAEQIEPDIETSKIA